MTTQTVLRQMPELENALKQRAPGLCLEAGALMARYTTLHLGGPADLLATPREPEELQLLLEEARRLAVPLTLMGQGSNMLVRDGGIRGLVVRIASGMRGVEVHGDKVTGHGRRHHDQRRHGRGGKQPGRADLCQRASPVRWAAART